MSQPLIQSLQKEAEAVTAFGQLLTEEREASGAVTSSH